MSSILVTTLIDRRADTSRAMTDGYTTDGIKTWPRWLHKHYRMFLTRIVSNLFYPLVLLTWRHCNS